MKRQGEFLSLIHSSYTRPGPPATWAVFLFIIVEFGRLYGVFGVYDRSTKAIIEGRSRANRNEDPAPGRVLSLFWRKL